MNRSVEVRLKTLEVESEALLPAVEDAVRNSADVFDEIVMLGNQSDALLYAMRLSRVAHPAPSETEIRHVVANAQSEESDSDEDRGPPR